MKQLIILSFILTFITSSYAVSCLDGSGNAVDWYFLLKLGSEVKNKYEGFTYAYFDSNSPGNYMIGNLEDGDNPVARTTMQLGLYVKENVSDDVGYLLYNDQTYDSFTAKHATSHYKNEENGAIYGHAKGFVGFDKDSSFWMIHSAPGFPYNHSMVPDHWYFPWGQTMFGQHFFCTSYGIKDVNDIADQLIYYYPWVYDHHIPTAQGSAFPVLESIINGEKKSGNGEIHLTSKGGATLQGISKSWDTNSDLYEDFLAPALKTSLKAVTWCGGTFGWDCTPSYCAGQKIVNPSTPQQSQATYKHDVVLIDEMYFGLENTFNITWNHSKWAISYDPITNKTEPWFCACDINRAITQRKRGGGALCIKNQKLWDKLNFSVIREYDRVCEK